MRVKLTGLMAGPGGVFDVGSVVSLADIDARNLVKTGKATLVDDDPVVEQVKEEAPKPKKGRRK